MEIELAGMGGVKLKEMENDWFCRELNGNETKTIENGIKTIENEWKWNENERKRIKTVENELFFVENETKTLENGQ